MYDCLMASYHSFLFAVEDNEVFDFSGVRLDWFRLQVGCTIPLQFKIAPVDTKLRKKGIIVGVEYMYIGASTSH